MNFLNLTKIGENTYESVDLWSPFPGFPVFGGQLSAQCLCAGLLTVNSLSVPNMIHSLFLNPGDPTVPMKYTVEIIKSGKTLQMMNIFGRQNKKSIIQTTLCCTLPDSQYKDYTKKIEIFNTQYMSLKEYFLKHVKVLEVSVKKLNLIFDNLKKLTDVIDIKIGEYVDNNKRQVKIELLKNNISKHDFYMYITLVSDLVLAESALLCLDLNVFSKELHKISSLDYNLYFIGSNIPKTNVLYYILECVDITECKASIEGKMCTEDGTLICDTSQQALVRLKESIYKHVINDKQT